MAESKARDPMAAAIGLLFLSGLGCLVAGGFMLHVIVGLAVLGLVLVALAVILAL
jgi:hypothetical protein